MKIRKRRVIRIRDELRQWLRSRHGLRLQYTKQQIDAGREDLGFSSTDDVLVAYTLFGADLVPAFLEASELPISAELIDQIMAASADGLTEVAEFIAGGD